MQIGIIARPDVESRRGWHEQVRRLDDLGADVVGVPDHLPYWSPLLALVSASAASDRLRLRAQVLNNEFYNPVVLARDIVAANIATDGRLDVGLGAGHTESEFDDAGIVYERAGIRVDRLEAALPVVMSGIAGVGPSLGGTTAPVSAPPQLMIGGNGDRVLALAGQHADIAGLTGFTSGNQNVHTDLTHFRWAGLADRIARVRAAAKAAERPCPAISVLVQSVIATDDRASLATARPGGHDPAMLLDSPFMMWGTHTELAEHLEQLAKAGVDDVTTFAPDAETLLRAAGRG